MTETKRSTKRNSSASASGDVFSDEELAAMQETIRERKRAAKLSPEEARAAGEADVQAKIAEMVEADRAIAARIHEIVLATAPTLVPRTFYGMPAYARDGKVICFFQAKSKFKVRYSTLGFQPDARLDEGTMWPIASRSGDGLSDGGQTEECGSVELSQEGRSALDGRDEPFKGRGDAYGPRPARSRIDLFWALMSKSGAARTAPRPSSAEITRTEWSLHQPTCASASLRVQPSMPGIGSTHASSDRCPTAATIGSWVVRISARKVCLSMPYPLTASTSTRRMSGSLARSCGPALASAAGIWPARCA